MENEVAFLYFINNQNKYNYGKKERTIRVFAISDCGTTMQATMTEKVDDLTDLINKAINKIKQFEKKTKNLK